MYLLLQVQNFSAALRIQKLYQNRQDMKEGIGPVPDQERQFMPVPRLSPARRMLNIDVLAADYRAGGSLRELAAKYGTDRKTVALQLKKTGVVLRLPRCNLHIGAL